MITEEFLKAFNYAMLYEVGRHWNPKDPEVIAGKCDTRAQKIKVGYTNNLLDPGGETKFGIAQRANRDIDVKTCTLAQAHTRFNARYYLTGKCDQLPYPLALVHFDGCVNHGVAQANKFLQRAVGVTDDGFIGSLTLAATVMSDQEKTIDSIARQRRAFYEAIVKRDPSQVVFLKGWKLRIDEIHTYALSEIK